MKWEIKPNNEGKIKRHLETAKKQIKHKHYAWSEMKKWQRQFRF
jgi:hypothetical protein